MDDYILLVLCVVKVEDSVTCRSLVQRCPTECGVSESDLETTSTVRRPRPTGSVEPYKKFLTNNCTINILVYFIAVNRELCLNSLKINDCYSMKGQHIKMIGTVFFFKKTLV